MDKIPHRDEGLVLGVDTHLDRHVAVLLDPLGRRVDSGSFPASAAGYRELLAWAEGHGPIAVAGIEGTGSYGAGLARHLHEQDIGVIEVTRASRRAHRHRGKSDPRDAEGAARAVLSGEAAAGPKLREGIVESIRVLRITRSTAVKARTQATIQLQTMIVTAPDDLRDELIELPARERIERCAGLRPGAGRDSRSVTKRALRSLARRHQCLDGEIKELERELAALVTAAAPRLLAQPGVGIETAAKLLVIAGDNPKRLRSDGALAALCGASPVEASSGKVTRHRLNRGGDRQGNNALYRVAMNRMIHDPETREYVERRTAEGKSRREIRRCLMRHLARRIFPLLVADIKGATTLDLT